MKKSRVVKWVSALCAMAMSVAFAADNTVTVKATPVKGQVFAGWYTNVERTVAYDLGGVDYRTAQMTYAPDETDTLFSRFATEAEDKDSIDFDLSLNPYYNSNAPLAIPLSGAVKSLSLPTLTVANLPTGVKYDAKTLSLTGTPTKPGETKDVKFTIKNLSDKAGKVFTRTFKIGDAQAASLPDLHYNDANGYPAFTPGAAVDMANVLGTATMATLAEGGWAVTGLPAGMTFNSKDGTFKGAPTAANTSYLVTFKKGTGANAETATITLKTGALPELEIGANIVDEAGLPVTDEAVLKQIRLTGAGAYVANKAVTLSATAPKGYVFAGWYDEGGKPVDGGAHDFRTASGYQFKMLDIDTKLIAKFIPISEDRASINDMQFEVSLATGESMQADFIKNAIWSGSFPTVTVRGLPAGITFNATTLLLSGKATDKTPKWYDLVVSVKNAGGYTYTGIFGVSVNGGRPVADVDELGLGSTLDWLDNLKVGGIVEDESSFGTSGDGVTGVTISPAMPEIKIYKESYDDGETIFLVDEINGEMPVVKTPGVYTATVNGRVNGKAAKTTKRFIVRDSVGLYEHVLVAPGCEGMGTVTGDGKVVHPGEAFAINATPKAGCLFAGWYADPECNSRAWFMPEVADYRQASQSGTVSTDESPGEDVFAYGPTKLNPTVRYARFIQKADDADIRIEVGFAPRLLGDGVYDFADFRDGAEFQVKIFSGTLPTVTFQNLPTWIDKDPVRYFDGLFLWYNENSEPDPGEYPFTVTAKNLSGATAERKITIRVPNYQNPSLPLDYENGYTLVPGAAFNVDEVMPDVDLTGWTVTGLPAGMTFDSRTGSFKGAPTTPDKSYTVWFKKAGEKTATITMRTGELPKLGLEAVVSENGIPVIDEEVSRQVRVTGAGAYAANKMVSLSATAPKGYVFAGWHDKDLKPVDGVSHDFRTASGYQFKMLDIDTKLIAKFIPISEDRASINDMQFEVSLATGESMQADFIKNAIWSGSFPTVTVRGLPAGITFNATTLLLSGKATDKTPKWYDLVVSVKNAGGYTYTGIFGVSVNGGRPVADVDELGLGSTLDWLDNLKVGGIVEDESSFGTSGDGVTGVTISPAMPEIKIYKESYDDGETIFLVDEINGEMPVVKTPGVYTATVNGRVNGKAAKTTKRFIVRDSVGLYEHVLVAPGCEGMGTVTGDGKVVHPGEAFAINATPKAGCLFAGWYADPECNSRAWFMPEVADYRQASQSGTVSTDESPGEDVFAYGPTKLNPTVRYARFIQKADDADIRIEVGFAPRLLGDGVYDFADFRDGAEFQVKIFSGTLPTVTFQNLPTWIDKDPVRYFDGLFLWYNENSEPDPGEYPFTVTAKNLSGATAERKITIRVPNYQNPSLPLDYENGYTLVPGAAFNVDEVMPDVDLTGWTVTGLPAGMTFDSRTGSFKGAPTTPDKSYTVWFKKAGEDTATVTMRTKPYPKLAIKALLFDEDVDVVEVDDSDMKWYESPFFKAAPATFKTTGAGNYQAGSRVTLGATAPAGYIFCGWATANGEGFNAASWVGLGDSTDTSFHSGVKDGQLLDPAKGGTDARMAAYSLIMPEDDVTTLYAVFAAKEYDWVTRSYTWGEDEHSLATQGKCVNVGDDVVKVLGATFVRDLFRADSFPTITCTDMPAGMKFDAKSLLVSGTFTKAGYYYAKFAAKSVAGFTYTTLVKFIVREKDSVEDPVDATNIDTITDNWGGIYTFWLDNLKVGTGVGANIPEGDEYDWLRDDEDEVADYEIYCGGGSSMDGIQSISGLPPGLKVVKETETSGSYIYYDYEYSIEGVPTTPGWYTVTIDAKDFEGKACKLVKRVPVFDMPDDWIDVEVAEGCETMGTVTGGGLVTAGKTFTITATPKAGYAFAGWYRQAWSSENMSEVLVPATNMSYNTAWKFYDWRDPSQVWMNDANCPWQLVAKFVPKAEATGETIVSVTSYETWDEMAGGEAHKLAEPVPLEGFNWVIQPASSGYEGDVLDLELSFDAATLPKVTISGLPKGFDATDIGPLWGGQGFLEFDNGVDASSGPEPGDYPVTLTIVNQGVTTKVDFTITIGQYHSWEMDQAGLQTAYSLDVGAASDDWLTALGITGDLTSGKEEDGFSWTWSVTGLPKGLTFNKTTGKITGTLAAVTADTTSIVHIKKTSTYPGSGTFTEEATTAITVKALPLWLVGTFYGFANVQGVDKNEDGDPNWPDEDDYWEWPNAIEVKVAASGAVTATILDPDSTRITLKTTNVYRTGDSFRFDFTNSLANGEHSTGSVTISRTWMDNDEKAPLGYLHGTETGVDEDEDLFEAEWTAYQDAYTVKPVGVTLPTFAASDSTLTIDVDDVYSTRFGELGTGPLDGELTLRFAPNGAVTPTWRGDTVFTMVAAHMTPITVIDGFTHAKVWVMGYDRVNDEAIGLSINLSIPNTGAPIKASEVNPRFETVILDL